MDPVPRESFSKHYPVISPSLMKHKWGDPLKLQFKPAFDLGFPEFTDPDYKHYATLLDGLSDLDVLFGDDPLKPEQPPSKRFKHCAYAKEKSRKPDPFCSVAPITFSMRHAEHTENDRRYRTERVLLARLAEEAMSAASALKDVTNHKWFGPITTSPERMLHVV